MENVPEGVVRPVSSSWFVVSSPPSLSSLRATALAGRGHTASRNLPYFVAHNKPGEEGEPPLRPSPQDGSPQARVRLTRTAAQVSPFVVPDLFRGLPPVAALLHDALGACGAYKIFAPLSQRELSHPAG
jgi:hypothetical protein